MTEVIGEGAYESEGHRIAQFPNATNVGPYPGECKRAWKAARDEAMQNLGMRDDPDKEGWEKMGLLADPTPTNAKNRGAADRRRRRGEVNMRADEEINEAHAPPAARTEGSGEEATNVESSDMEDIRDTVAEVIHEMELAKREAGTSRRRRQHTT